MPDVVLRDLAGWGGARADQAHVALQDVEQLRELIEGPLPYRPSQGRDPRIVCHLECRPLRVAVARDLGISVLSVDGHGPELVDREWAPMSADAGLAEQDRPPVLGPDHDRD